MQIELLRTFCDLVETRHLSRTAELSQITQPAVSQQLRNLEEKFARRLLFRPGSGRREFSPTPAGVIFYRECKKVLAGYDALCEEMSDGSISGTVKVSSVYSAGIYDLPPVMREFMQKFPAAKIDLEYSRPERIVRDVLSREVDLGVVAFPDSNRALKTEPVISGKLVLICAPGHEFATRLKIRTTELRGRDLVLFERGMPARRAIDKILKSHGVKICCVAEFANIDIIKLAVEADLGIAVVPRSSVVKEVRNKTVSVLELAGKDWIYPLGVIYRKGQTLSPAARKFVELLAGESYKTND